MPDRLTPLLDTSARLLTETIATGRNRILLCYLCLQLSCLAASAKVAVSMGKHCPLPKHTIVKGVVIVIKAVVCRRMWLFALTYPESVLVLKQL